MRRSGGEHSSATRKQPPLISRAAFVAALVFAIAAGCAIGVDRQFLVSSVIAPGVSIVRVPVGGLDGNQAVRVLSKRVAAPTTLRLTSGKDGKSLKIPCASAGLTYDFNGSVWRAARVGRQGGIIRRFRDRQIAKDRGVNIPLTAHYNLASLKYVLVNGAKERFASPPKDARIIEKGGMLYKYREVAGTAIDIKATLHRAVVAPIAEPAGMIDLPVVLSSASPRVTLADIDPIDTELAAHTTTYHTYERSRSHNLIKAAEAVDGTLVKSGEEFSYNQIVGPRLKKTGYLDAKIFVNGKIEDGTGGGICQVSSTLYYAALLSGVKIKQRNHHSMVVRYVPAGLDATVSYGALDFKFLNTLKFPIYIQMKAGGGRLSAKLYGAASDKKTVRIVRHVGRSIPYGFQTAVNLRMKPGSRRITERGINGCSVTVNRIIEEGGKKRVELVSNDRYQPHPALVQVGPPAAMPIPPPVQETTPEQ